MPVAALLLAAPVAFIVLAPSARADSCRVMTLTYGLSTSGLVVLDPDHYDIPYGGCVQFVNQTAATATITVGSHYTERLGPNGNTAGSTNFHGTTPGTLPVTATSGPSGNTAHGSITVGPAPRRTHTPKPSARPTKTANPAPASSPSTSGSNGPQVAPTPTHSGSHRHHHGGLQPPVSPPGPVQTQLPAPSASPSPAPTAIVAGPIEPASGRGAGLPTALAALAVVGSGAAFVRVLVAEPVDDGKNVG